MTGLEALDKLAKQIELDEDVDFWEIRNAHLLVEKSLKALEIIKEKRVDLPYLRCCIEDNQSVYRYNEYIRNKTMDYDHEEELTEEEFNLLKEVLE